MILVIFNHYLDILNLFNVPDYLNNITVFYRFSLVKIFNDKYIVKKIGKINKIFNT